jgi:hypothetical protein
MAKHIKINTVNGTGTDGNALKNCYFEESGNGYNFYQPTPPNPTKLNTNLIDPQVPSSCTFQFNLAGTTSPTYTITVTSFPAVLTMSGNWSDLDQERIEDTPGSGTFQAESSGTGPIAEGEAHAASGK